MKARILLLILSNILFLLLLTSCAHTLEESAASVDVYYSLAERTNCDYIGDVIGSDGNFLTFLFISNVDLTQGALNDIRHKALVMGGDSVFILLPQLDYGTTTTFVGSVYRCHKEA